jgi:hypothetical protein
MTGEKAPIEKDRLDRFIQVLRDLGFIGGNLDLTPIEESKVESVLQRFLKVLEKTDPNKNISDLFLFTNQGDSSVLVLPLSLQDGKISGVATSKRILQAPGIDEAYHTIGIKFYDVEPTDLTESNLSNFVESLEIPKKIFGKYSIHYLEVDLLNHEDEISSTAIETVELINSFEE